MVKSPDPGILTLVSNPRSFTHQHCDLERIIQTLCLSFLICKSGSLTESLLQACCFIYIICNHHSNPRVQVLLCHFMEEKEISRRSNDFPKTTQLPNGRSRGCMQTKMFWLPSSCFFPLTPSLLKAQLNFKNDPCLQQDYSRVGVRQITKTVKDCQIRKYYIVHEQ